MKLAYSLARDTRGSAAAEMALVLPLLLIIMFGAAELGNYFMNEHSLVKAVRDGARFAARQSLTNYTMCSGSPGGSVVADTQNVVARGYLSGGTKITPNIDPATDVTVTVSCTATAGGEDMLGIYRSRFGNTCNGSTANGCAQVVVVSATVNYRPILAAFGFTGVGYNLNASSEAAVAGI
jgi:Flp pilus assembly protein TadG